MLGDIEGLNDTRGETDGVSGVSEKAWALKVGGRNVGTLLFEILKREIGPCLTGETNRTSVNQFSSESG